MTRQYYTVEFQDGEWWCIENILEPRPTKWHSTDRADVQYEADRMNAIYSGETMQQRGRGTTRVYREFQASRKGE